MFAPGVPLVLADFHTVDNVEILGSLVVSIFILGYALGPMVVAPLSEMYGRVILYHISNVLFVVFTIACAVSSNIGMLIAFRLLAGIAGSTVLTIGGGTVTDMFIQEERGGAMAIWSMGPLLGPVIGPVIGGFLAEDAGWRWVFWLLAICGGAVLALFLLFMRETYAPVILRRKAARLRKETGNPNLYAKGSNNLPPRALFARAIVRPFKMLIFSPIVLTASIYCAVIYGYLYLLFTTITDVFIDTYGWSEGIVGLSYIGIGVGMMLGLALIGIFSDKFLKKKAAANGGELKPEYRLPFMIPGSFAIPIGLFLYGWTADKGVFWIVPIIGTALVGFGLIGIFMAVNTYLVDVYPMYAASAMASSTILRSLVGALLPLAGPAMYSALGLGWGNSLLGFIAVAFLFVPFFFLKYGEYLRKKFVVTL